jgi:hypothetical protein
MKLSDDVLAEIQSMLLTGYYNRYTVFKDALEMEEVEEGCEALLESAIEEAFAAREAESKSWPVPTDCERLQTAFKALDAQGIVTMENCGSTLQEGGAIVADLSCAREDLVGGVDNGCCFFNQQDVAGAVEQDELFLAFNTYAEDPERALPSAFAFAPCQQCGGRGWTSSSTPRGWEYCPCGGAPRDAAQPARTVRSLIGEKVVLACREAGLAVAWEGSANVRVSLPGFKWQRRFVHSTEADAQFFLDDWQLAIRSDRQTATSPNILRKLEKRAEERFFEFADFSRETLRRFNEHTLRFLEAERSLEASWQDVTMNDRIEGAFEHLRARDIFADESTGLTIQDGWAYVGIGAPTNVRAAVFFHREDVVDALDGKGLYLAFGSVSLKGEGDECDSIGGEIARALCLHGVPYTWSGNVSQRIRVLPFAWQKRRWTARPSYVLNETSSDVVLSATPGVQGADSAPEHAIVVKALRDEGGFNLKRSRHMRAVWKELGYAGDAHVAHLGIPHAFLPTGQHTTMMPMRSSVNLGAAERLALYRRGAKVKS